MTSAPRSTRLACGVKVYMQGKYPCTYIDILKSVSWSITWGLDVNISILYDRNEMLYSI